MDDCCSIQTAPTVPQRFFVLCVAAVLGVLLVLYADGGGRPYLDPGSLVLGVVLLLTIPISLYAMGQRLELSFQSVTRYSLFGYASRSDWSGIREVSISWRRDAPVMIYFWPRSRFGVPFLCDSHTKDMAAVARFAVSIADQHSIPIRTDHVEGNWRAPLNVAEPIPEARVHRLGSDGMGTQEDV